MPHAEDNPADAPLVSVVIPSHNCERYIAETIGSVLGQTHRDVEVLVVDDGSTDRTREIAGAFGSPVRLIEQDNAGVCVARNRGAREARGRFVCFMDHDDYWFPDKLARQVDAMRRHPECGVVFAGFILWNPLENGEYPAPAGFDLSGYPCGDDAEFSGWIYHKFLLDCWMLTSTAMFRREVFRECGLFDESLPYSEDWDLWLRIARVFPFVKLGRPNTLYRQHPGQGNRVVRPVDYRTRLLVQAVKRWGYASPDGRAVSRGEFRKKLAEYHAHYGLHQIANGRRARGIGALARACATEPFRLRYLACVMAALLGWKPKH